MQAAEQRASDTEKKLKETERRMELAGERAEAAEERAELAEERAARAEQATLVAQKRTELAEEHVMELERKLFEADNDLDELLVRDTERMALETASGPSCGSGNGSINILRTSCNSLSGFFLPDQHQQGLSGERHCNEGSAGDELSITSL